MSSEETPSSFSKLRLLKSEVRNDGRGLFAVLEFVDEHGTIFKTPAIPYPENFDPMRIENADYRGDEIRIKNDAGQVLISIHADSIEWDNPIGTSTNPNGQMFIDPEEGEDGLPVRTFSLSQGQSSEIGFTQAFERANREAQVAQDIVTARLNDNIPMEERQRALAQLEQMRYRRSEGFPFTNGTFSSQVPEPAIPKPEFKTDYKMKCSCCDDKIHYPDKMIQLLGNDGTEKYFKFCEKTGSEPQLFCCSCYGIMQRNSSIISAVNKMNEKIKSMMDLTDREEAVTKREEELDVQLKKKK